MSERRLTFSLLTALLGAALLLAGCASGPDWNAIGQQAQSINAGCESQFGSGIIKTHLGVEQCANPPIRDLYGKAGWPDMDVLDAYLARRESIAEQWDRKAITDEEAHAQFAQAAVTQNSELQHRYADRAVSAAAWRSTFPVMCSRAGAGFFCQ